MTHVTRTLDAQRTSPVFRTVWLLLVAGSTMALIRDLRRNNPEIAGLMKWVWIFTVVCSGPIGLAIYAWSGRKQIPRDSLARKADVHEPLFRSSLVFSLSVGLFAAYPVNVLLIHLGVKEGMHDPREHARHAHA